MNYVLKISTFLTLGSFSLFLQAFNFFKIGSINPNLILILFSSLVIFYKRDKFLIIGSGVFLGLTIWSYFFIPFWFEGILIIGVLTLIVSFIKLNFTGNKLIDSLIILLILTLLFSLIAWVIGLQSFGWFIAFETLYNALMSIPFYFIVKWLRYNTK